MAARGIALGLMKSVTPSHRPAKKISTQSGINTETHFHPDIIRMDFMIFFRENLCNSQAIA